MSNEPITAEPPPPPSPALVVFGTDDAGKAHASAFKPEEAELAAKAAGLMGMHVLQLATPEHHALAAKLPVGRIFASGKGFVPFVGRSLYEDLCGFSGLVPDAQPQRARKLTRKVELGTSLVTSIEIQNDWEGITAGCLVLALGDPQDGWWEAVVQTIEPDDSVVVRWRDFPDMEAFSRRRDQLALLPNTVAPAPQAKPEATVGKPVKAGKNKP